MMTQFGGTEVIDGAVVAPMLFTGDGCPQAFSVDGGQMLEGMNLEFCISTDVLFIYLIGADFLWLGQEIVSQTDLMMEGILTFPWCPPAHTLLGMTDGHFLWPYHQRLAVKKTFSAQGWVPWRRSCSSQGYAKCLHDGDCEMSGLFQMFLTDWKTGIEFVVSVFIRIQQASGVTLKTCGMIHIFLQTLVCCRTRWKFWGRSSNAVTVLHACEAFRHLMFWRFHHTISRNCRNKNNSSPVIMVVNRVSIVWHLLTLRCLFRIKPSRFILTFPLVPGQFDGVGLWTSASEIHERSCGSSQWWFWWLVPLKNSARIQRL